MQRFRLSSILGLSSALGIVLLSGCGGGGWRTFNGDGNIQLTSVVSNTVITGTQTNPYQITNTFTMTAYEGNYTGNFQATIVTYNNECFTIVPVTTLASPGFTIKANPTTTNNPCQAGTLEQIVVADSNGHSTTLWVELTNGVLLAS